MLKGLLYHKDSVREAMGRLAGPGPATLPGVGLRWVHDRLMALRYYLSPDGYAIFRCGDNTVFSGIFATIPIDDAGGGYQRSL